jgi:heme ABC exporter ATP-binding subunit CcmA
MSKNRPAIELDAVSCAFGRQVVLRRLSFAVGAGESVAVRGANGAGKTTLLRCLAAAIRPIAGEVRWFGRPAASNPVARRLIGWVAHETHLYSHLTLQENLAFAARMCGVPKPAQAARQWLGEVGLLDCAGRFPSGLSRGLRQRAAIARALLHDPAILLLDEPFSSLDADGRAWLLRLLAELRDRGRTICFVAHDAEVVEHLADRTLELRSGRVCEPRNDPPGVLRESPLRAA